MASLRDLATPAGIEVLDNNLAAMPAGRREVEMLMVGGDAEELKRHGGCVVRQGVRHGARRPVC